MTEPQQHTQQMRILHIYAIYQLTLSLVLLVSFLVSPVSTRLGSFDPRLFITVAGAYVLYSIIVTLIVRVAPQRTLQERPLATLFITDTIIITVLAYSSGGMVSGLGLLLLVTVAAGSMLVRKRLVYLLPAVASIVIIYAEVYLTLSSDDPPRQYIQAGLLGALLFASAAYLQSITRRMERSTVLAEQQASSIHDLEQLNYRIVQRMRTGMILVDAALQPISLNTAARELLGLPDNGTHDTLPARLQQAVRQWQQDRREPPPIRPRRSAPELRLRLNYLHPDEDSHILIFLEDNSAFLQRVRQMKLASLGELTASIAHEIRNPLGALSHAGQLLAESQDLGQDDRQLLEMMLKNSRRINLIIEDVLSLSRQREQPPEILLLRDWLEEFVDDYCRSHHPDAEVDIRITPTDCHIRFIPSQLQQVLGNLIDNGLRYSRRTTGKALLKLSGGYRSGSLREQAFLNVIDEGPGVSDEVQERLFEPFHTTESSGTGLGLYISRQLCEANHARLIYRLTRQGKSCFSLYFNPPERDLH
ncbi:MAG: HAMP domain-containing sensor histidine kinase [Pseudohongiellaceae bacterium]